MNESDSPTASRDPLRDMSREEIMSALFGHMVIQNTNMALMFLGQVPHPESGERMHDLDAARMFIDQLEMLEAKTKGNLSREEEKLLLQSLTHLRMTFVQAVENSPGEQPKTDSPPAPEPPKPAGDAPAAGSADDEPRKRFSKKF